MAFWAAAIPAALQLAGGLMKGKGEKSDTPTWSTAPEYAESEGARKMWWDKLQSWSSDPNYGAISPDWANIWQQAIKKVKDYYSGSPTGGGGAYGKLKSSFASRNMSSSPAMARSLARLSAEETGQIKDLAATEAINKATFGEQGRRDWLSSLERLQGQKPTSQFYMEPAKTTNSQLWGSALQGIGGAASAYGTGLQNQQNLLQQQNFLKDLLGRNTTQTLPSLSLANSMLGYSPTSNFSSVRY